MPRQPIQPPLNGLSDDLAFSEQAPGTTREGVNMRSIDPTNGRRRLAQRSGLSRLTVAAPLGTGAGALKVQDMAVVPLDVSHIDYAQLGNIPSASANGTLFSEWVYPGRNLGVFEPQLDSEGNIFIVELPSTITKLNSAGEVVASFNPPVDVGGVLSRGLAIDENDAIYCSVHNDEDDTAKIFKYEALDEERFVKRWEIDGFGSARQIVTRDGLLFIHERNSLGSSYEHITCWAGIYGSTPINLWRRTVSNPCAAIAIGGRGGLFGAYEPNSTNRGASPDSPDTTTVTTSWNPHELDDSENRIHFWVASDGDVRRRDGAALVPRTQAGFDSMAAAAAGDFIGGVGDRRNRWATSGGGGYSPMNEFGDAALDGGASQSDGVRAFLNVGLADRTPPTLREGGLAGREYIHFDGEYAAHDFGAAGQAIYTDTNEDGAAVGADFTNHCAMIPGNDNCTHATFLVVRLLDVLATEGTSKVIFSQHGNSGSTRSYGLLTDTTGSGTVHTLTFEIRTGDSAPGLDNGGTTMIANSDAGPADEVITASLPAGENIALVTIVCGDHGGTNTSEFRVNGTMIDVFSITGGTNQSLGINSEAVFGSPWIGDDASKVGLYYDASHNSWTGELYEAMTVRGTGALHVTPPTSPLLSTHSTVAASTEIEKIEGYLAHRWGISHLLPKGNGGGDPDETTNHPFGGIGNHPVATQNDDFVLSDVANDARTEDGFIVKYNAVSGTPLWLYTQPNGIGYGVTADDVDGVFTAGTATVASDPIVRKFLDNGQTFDDSSSGVWTAILDPGPPAQDWIVGDQIMRMVLDASGDLLINTANGASANALHKYQGDDGTYLFQYTLARQSSGMVIDPAVPVYRNANVRGNEFIYIAYPQASLIFLDFQKLRLVSATQNTSLGFSPREFKYLGVSNGDIKKFTRGGVVSTPTGGAAALVPASPYINSVTLFGKVFWADGESYKYYDPIEDEVLEWKSTSAGSIPPRGKLLTAWRGRAVIARTADDGHNWYMSAQGDPFDWNLAPVFPTVTQATAGNTSLAGTIPDLINGLIPYNDDLMIIGCDHSVWRMTGDPQAGGQAHLVSDVTGMAYGKAWCKDPDGIVYFFGSTGGVYAMAPSGPVARLTVNSIERRLRNIDLSQYQVRMVWNYEDEGIHLFFVPNAQGGAAISSYFWDKKNKAWWEDQWGNTLVQPTSVIVMDGDLSDDRKVLIGCEDGNIRYFNGAALNDDTYAIDSQVLMQMVRSPVDDLKLSQLSVVLGAKEGGCIYECFASDEATDIGDAVVRGELFSGRNVGQAARMRGSDMWIRMRNVKPDERWSFEEGSIVASRAGRKRVR